MKQVIEVWYNGYRRELSYGSQFIRMFHFLGTEKEAITEASVIKEENNDMFDRMDRDMRCGVSVNGNVVY
ncbi:MAG: hypothetical protein ACTSW7_00705 [Candidatus Thorarchaeota archaeon]|nr:MAG: hypothetical protein DRQ25_15415 [Candidatus Fermentibacteria bacterium]HEC72578.1 hypothetical protein [Thermoplasmatales archaeon]